jgi:hypothetical protein
MLTMPERRGSREYSAYNVRAMKPGITAAAFAAALLAGAALRASVLPIRVQAVDESWRAWSYHAATDGAARTYGPRGHTVRFGDIDVPVVYPPLALDELGILGRIYATARHGRFPDDEWLTMAIKGTIVLFDAALAGVIYLTLRRTSGASAARLGAAAYWLNPAVLFATSLGYLDALMALPATAAVIGASFGYPAAAGALLSAAVMTKPQGIFVAPVVALAVWKAGDRDRALAREVTAALAAALVAVALLVPFFVAGTAYYLVRSVAVLARHDMLSALAFNVWWIVTYLFAAASASAGGVRAALSAEPAILTHAYAMQHGFPHPRLVALVLLVPIVARALHRARFATDVAVHAALAAFIVVTYFMLSVQVHENHFFLALPFLTIAAVGRPELAAVSIALSVTFALNLYLTYGWAGHAPAATRLPLAQIDATVVIAMVNCGLYAWLGAALARVCRDRRPVQIR